MKIRPYDIAQARRLYEEQSKTRGTGFAEMLKKMVSETEKSIWNYRFSIANHLARIALRYGRKVKLGSIKGKRYVIIEWELLPYFSEHLIVRE